MAHVSEAREEAARDAAGDTLKLNALLKQELAEQTNL